MTLFDQWLEETHDLQINSYNVDPAKLEGEERIEYIRYNYIAAIKELGEMMDEVGWKPWASSRHVNEDAAASEVVDVLHFCANLLVCFGWDDDKLDLYYMSKMLKNRDRMASGSYDGVTGKCSGCGRALDDEFVLCTKEMCVDG